MKHLSLGFQNILIDHYLNPDNFRIILDDYFKCREHANEKYPIWSPLHLSFGDAGILIWIASIYHETGDSSWLVKFHEKLRANLTHLSALYNQGFGLYSGGGGLLFSLYYMRQKTDHYNQLIESLERNFLNYIKNCNKCLDKQDKYISVEYDVISGWSGVCRLLLNSRNPEILSQVLLFLENITNKIGLFGVELFIDELSEQKKFVNLGFAHGVSGIIALLSIAKKCVGVNYDNAICILAEGISFNLLETESKVSINPKLFVQASNSTIAPLSDRPAWCYGPGGALFALALAARATGNIALAKRVEDNFIKLCNKTQRELLLFGDTLCHGYSGWVQILGRSAQVLDSQTIYDQWDIHRRKLVENFDSALSLGFLDADLEGRRFSSPGFLTGAIGSYLVAGASDFLQTKPISWDQLLLLS